MLNPPLPTLLGHRSIKVEWRHMSVFVSQITCNWTVCSSPSDINKEKRPVKHIKFGRQIWAQSDQWFMWKCEETAKPTRGQETAIIQRPKVNQVGGGPQWVTLPNLSSIVSAFCLQMYENCPINRRPGNGGNSERDQKLIRVGLPCWMYPPSLRLTQQARNGLKINQKPPENIPYRLHRNHTAPLNKGSPKPPGFVLLMFPCYVQGTLLWCYAETGRERSVNVTQKPSGNVHLRFHYDLLGTFPQG